METNTANAARHPWNKGNLVGQRCPFKLKEIWAIRIRLQIAGRPAAKAAGRPMGPLGVPNG